MSQRISIVRENEWKKWLGRAFPFFYFVTIFFLYYSLMSDPYFTDEQDVIFGGYQIAKGRDLYQHYLSQHMPFSYYFAALSAACGARTVYQFRLCAYLLLSGVWELIYLRHRRHFPIFVFLAMPLLYLGSLKTIPFGTTMISDHWQGIGQVMIMLELIRYPTDQSISLPCAGMVCLGILLSFGTVFVAAYPVFCYFLGMVALQFQFCLRERKKGNEESKKRMIWEDFRLTLICLVPFIVLGLWYAFSGNLENAYEGAYGVNVQFYPQYTSGFGGDPLGIVWETPVAFGAFLWRELSNPAGKHLINAALALGAIGCSFWLGMKNRIVGIVVFLAVVYSGIRGFDNFHGMAYYAQASALIALGWGTLLEMEWKKKWVKRGIWMASGCATVLLLSPFVIWAGYNLIYPQILLDRTPRAETEILRLLTEPGEEIHSCETPYFSQDVMDLELIPQEASDAVSIPWYFDMWQERQMASIEKHPRIVMYNSDEKTWGRTFREYAPEFDAYIRSNYIKLTQAEDIWVLKEYYDEAEEKLDLMGYGHTVFPKKEEYAALTPVEFYKGQSVKSTFVAQKEKMTAIRYCASCFRRRSDPWLTIQVRDSKTQTVCGEGKVTGKNIADDFYSRCPLQASLTPEKEYEIEIRIDRIGGKGDVEFYFRPEGDLAVAVEYD